MFLIACMALSIMQLAELENARYGQPCSALWVIPTPQRDQADLIFKNSKNDVY
jgi:hypothetical protein